MFSAGETVFQYQVGSGGARPIGGHHRQPVRLVDGGRDAARRIITAGNQHLLASEYGAIAKRSIDAQAAFQAPTPPRP